MKIDISSLFELKTISSPCYDSAGHRLAYVIGEMRPDTKTYYSAIEVLDIKEQTRQIAVSSSELNTQPIWGEKGDVLYYLSKRTGHFEVWQKFLGQSKEVQLTQTISGVKDYFLHPNGQGFFFLSAATEESSADDIFATESIHYKANGQGLLHHENKDYVYYQDFETGLSQPLCAYTLGYGLKKAACISPDGSMLAVEQSLLPDSADDQNTGLFLYHLDQNDPRMVISYQKLSAGNAGAWGEPVFSSDGKYLAVIGSKHPYQTINQFYVFIYSFAGEKWTTYLEKEDVQVTDFMVCDFKQHTSTSQLQWSKETNEFYALISSNGKVLMYAINPFDGEVRIVTDKEEHITDFAVHPSTGEAVLALSRPSCPSELVYLDLFEGTRSAAGVSVNEEWQSDNLASYHAFQLESHDGGIVPGFLVYPPHFNPAKKYPLIVNIHGGPYTMHGYTFHHEVQLMAARGYFVLLVNPRGSFGYGQHHLDGVLAKYGEGDYEDIMQAVEEVCVSCSAIDQTHLYVTGGSYGGYMTNWIVTQTNKFRAAATQRSMSNFVSMVGTSDIGYHFFVEENGADITQPDILWRKSPLAYITQVDTPVLVLHAEEDLRCPMEQAEQWYTALKYLGKKARFVRFPRENHELSRTGRAASRVRRLEELMNWFETN